MGRLELVGEGGDPASGGLECLVKPAHGGVECRFCHAHTQEAVLGGATLVAER